MTIVSTDCLWLVAVGGLDPGSVSVAQYETRRHMTTEQADTTYRMTGPAFFMARIGQPYRAWDTAELQATIDLNPVCKLAAQMGRPVRVVAERRDNLTSLGTIMTSVANKVTAALDTAANVVGAIVPPIVAAGTIALLGPIILAISGLIALFYFRKPIFGFLKAGA